MRWAFIGFIIELYGILVLFGDFLMTIAGFVSIVPVIGPYIAKALETISGARRNADLPVWDGRDNIRATTLTSYGWEC